MCGIAGILAFDAAIDPDTTLARMNLAQASRGPDDGGTWLLRSRRGGLANRRLAIRDLSPAGHMPMTDETGDVAITYNGEIYNAAELRSALQRDGVVFRSSSDTEVVLRGYLAWGDSVLERLRGIFAFGLVDQRPGHLCLVLARDRLGVKPLYYAASHRTFLFASELKALLTSGQVGRDIDIAGLAGYLMLGSVPNPMTIYRGIRGLEPGTVMTVPLDQPTTEPERRGYWSLPVRERAVSRAEAVEEVRAVLLEAVRSQLVSDVPLGAFLSGGLDSGVVVGVMQRAGANPIRTCSIGFGETEYDEASAARGLAASVGTEHVERTVSSADMLRELPGILQAMDQPTVDGVNTYFVSQTASQTGLTVALSGIGGDELFGGYRSTFEGVPQFVRAAGAVRRVPGGVALAAAGMAVAPRRDRLRKAADALVAPPGAPAAYLARRGVFSPGDVRLLLGEERWREAARSFDPYSHIAERAVLDGRDSRFEQRPFSWVSRAELGTYTQNQLLRDTDVMSMAHSLEVRVPLLDDRLVEAVLTLPDAVKRAGDRPKALLADAAAGLCPTGSLSPRAKQGFTFPFDRWLRGPVADIMRQMVATGVERGLVEGEQARRVLDGFQRGRMHWSRPWTLAALAAVAA